MPTKLRVTLGALLVSGGVALSLAAPAAALSGTCTHWYNKKVINNGPDEYRVGASCTSIGSDTKVRGVR
jgi:hypothetical protein